MEHDVRDLGGRARRFVGAAIIAVIVTRLALRGLEVIAHEKISWLALGCLEHLVGVAVFAGSVFVVAWGLAAAGLAAIARRRRRPRPGLPRARALRSA